MPSLLTEVVEIERDTPDLDIESDETQRWSSVGTVRAEVRPLRFSEAEREGATRTVQGYLFRVYTRAVAAFAITAADRLKWSGIVLNIREVRRPPPGETYTEIIAEAGVTS